MRTLPGESCFVYQTIHYRLLEMKKIIYLSLLLPLSFLFNSNLQSQQADIMMQGWYWDYPKTVQGANWADTLRLKTSEMGSAGFTLLWLPPLSRTASGGWSNGYDPKDLYDYGEFGQGATGFGTRSGLDQLMTALNGQNIKAVADVVYNHRDGGSVEDNPGLKNYIVNFYTWEKANAGANPFPYDRMRVVLPLGGSSGNGAGDYYFKFRSRSQHSKFYNWEYQVYMWTDKLGWQSLPTIYESEPNGGGDCSQPNNTMALGRHIHGQIDDGGCGIDEFKLTLTASDFNATGDAIYIQFDKRNSGYSDLYIHGIWSAPRSANIVNDLYYQTYTNYSWVPSGQGQMNWSNFKPNNNRETHLSGEWDAMYFYYDYDQYQTDTRDKLFAWTRWNWSDVGIRGFRMDAIKHFTPEFIGDLLDNLYDNNMTPPMVVGEWYGTNTDELAGWVNSVYNYMDNDTKQAIAPKIFDFSLREALRKACDQFGYNVRGVFDAGIVDQGKLNGLNVVTFANNHDFRDGSGFASLIQNDAILAYAYLLTNNQVGVPTVFYLDYFGYPQNGPNYHPPYKGGHKYAINQLISIHNQYIYGASGRTYLNKWGSGFTNSAGTTNDQLLVYQLKGSSGFKDVVVAINFSGSRVQFSQQLDGVAVGTRLSDLTGNSAHPVAVVEASANGVPNSIWIDLPARSYSVWRVGAWDLYDADRSWIGINAKGTTSYYRVWNSGAGNFQNLDMGTFTGADVLNLVAYDIKSWKQSGGDVTGGQLYYTIYPKGQRPVSPVFSSQSLNWMEDIGGSGTGNQKWGFDDASINLLSNLTSGEYTIELYSQMNGTSPIKSVYDANNGANYKAHFRYNYVRSNADGNWSAAATWLDQVIPDNATVSAEINHHVILSESKSVNHLKILGGSLTISSTFTFTVVGTASSTLNETGLILQSGLSGTASLIHNSPGVKATIQRHIPAANWSVAGEGWHLISPPVSGQAISGGWAPSGSGNDYDFYGWDEPSATWLNQKVGANNITHFIPGKGYLTAYQQTAVKEFAGPINVANHSVILTKAGSGVFSGWNLLGNPFASALDWKHASWNRNPAINGLAKIWSNGAYVEIDEDEPIIPSANGFFVYSDQNNIGLTIPAAARVHDGQNWYKSSGNRILLTAKAIGSEMVQRSVVKVKPQATEGFDLQFDSRFLTGYAPAFYSLANGEKLSTNTLPVITDQTAIPFHFVKNDAEEFQIALMESMAGLEVYLTDLKLNIQHKLSENPVYSFASASGDEPGRFLLHFGAVGLNDLNTSRKPFAWNTGDQLFVNNPAESATLSILDVQGRLLKTWNLVGEGIKQINLSLPKGIYVVTLHDDHTITSTKVVVY